ncbi:ATP-binding protein [Deinococcus sp.]|uniref:ATP-binding protein n=1 Tax=Deinococcus sp. TaxID=47478 RepID=UPI002869D7CE|nr:ATP-binding protein [Deinococcus sp.]
MTSPLSHHPSLDATELQAIIDASADCIKVLDLDARLLAMNVGGQQTMEITDFSVCHNLLWPTLWDGDARRQVEHALDAARAGQATTFEGATPTFAGTPKWWEVRVSPLYAPDGTVTRLLAVSKDITARKVAEQQLHASQQQLRDHAQTLEVRVGQHERALDAFVRFTTQVASSTELDELATAASDIIRDAVGGAISGFYLVKGDMAYPVVFSSNTPPAVIAARRAGIALSAPLVADALARRGTSFIGGEDGRLQSVGYASALSVTAYHVGDDPYALFATGAQRPDWTASEQAIIESVGKGLGLALERARQTQQLQERTAGLDAFVAFSEASGTTTDILILAREAVDALETTLRVVSVTYHELDGDLWKARVWSKALDPEIVAVLTEGIPVDAPSYAEAISTRAPLFVPGWSADSQGVAKTEEFGAGAFYPCFVGDSPRGLLAMGTQRAGDWTPREEAVFNAVGRSLTLALERAERVAQLAARTAQVTEAARAQAAFVAFTEAVGSEIGVDSLARLATTVVQAQLDHVSVAYYERQGELWIGVVWSDDVSPDVVAQMQRGVPLDAPDFKEAVDSGAAVFSEVWDAQANTLSDATMYGAAAFYPVIIGGEAQSILAVGKLTGQPWTEREQATVRAVGRGLGLVLERTAQARELTAQRDVLEHRTQALMAANEELEAFTYSASHDLRTPIRHVMGFADLAHAALVKNQPEKISRNLDIIKQGATRMEQLIDGMLMLSRAGRQDYQPHMVSLEPLILQAQQDAQLEFPDQTIEVVMPPPVMVWGDATLLQQVMTNLIRNAVKYSGRQEVSAVVVRMDETESEWVITVGDNGVGFDSRYAGKLFGIFQRLHTQDAFPGVGVGLAIVRRIVLKHGGRVFADSVEGQGATFGVALPKPSV